MTTPNCVFCEIVAGRSPATFVEQWPDAVAFRPLTPVVEGHTLVIPRQHVADAADNPQVTALTMERAAQLAGRHDSFNIITSAGKAATQSIFHLHVHVVPRAPDDGLMTPWGTVYGDDPTAPHWCRVAAEEREHTADLRARLLALDHDYAQLRAQRLHEGDPS